MLYIIKNMEDIRMANRINDFMPYNYGAQMRQVDRTVKQAFPTTLPRTVPRGFVSNRPPSVLGTTIVSANRAKEALTITESRRLRNDAYVKNFGQGITSGARGMSGERRKKKMKLLRDILEEQVRIREAGGIDEIKKIVSRLRQGGALSEAEVRRIEKAGYNVADILRELDAKVKRDYPEVHASEQYKKYVEATTSGRETTFQAIREETEGEVLAEAGVNKEIYESFIEGIRIGSSSEREALLEEFETYGEEAYRVLADRLVNEGIMEAMDIPGLTRAEVNVMEQIDDVVDYFRERGLTAMPMRAPSPPPPPSSAIEADLEMFSAMEDVSEEATVEEEVRDPFQDDAAMGTTLSLAMKEAENEIRSELAAEFIAQIPLGADMSGEPQTSAPTPQLVSEIERVSETKLVRTDSGTEELKGEGGVEEEKAEQRERRVLRPGGGRTVQVQQPTYSESAMKGVSRELLKEVRAELRQEVAQEMMAPILADRARGEELARQAQARRERD